MEIYSFIGVKIIKKHLRKKYKGESITLKDVKELRVLKHFIELPDRFFDELELFAERNAIYPSKILTFSNYPNSKVCLKCFKAFAIQKAKEINVSDDAIDFLSSNITSELGHENYYLDEGEARNFSENREESREIEQFPINVNFSFDVNYAQI